MLPRATSGPRARVWTTLNYLIMDLIALLSKRQSFILFSENQRKESTVYEEKLTKKSNYNPKIKLAQSKKK